ncbi:MAG: Crp/Fnr family transcriptional regulator [Alphaproteobacteria bacterium]
MLDPDELPPELAKSVVSRRLETGQTLFRQGSKAVAIFAVTEGRVRLVRHGAEGQTLTLHVAGPGDGIAEAALFSDSYHCDAVADVESVVQVFPKHNLRVALAADTVLADRFMALLARQVRDLRSRLELRNIRAAHERVLAWLLLEGAEQGLIPDRPLKQIAGEIGLSHEALYRGLARLERDGLLKRSAGRITLCRWRG